jgi:DNA-directed RNA polymerase subunit RPC12/RpoP
MTFEKVSDDPVDLTADGFFSATLPQVKCNACGRIIARRRHRMQLRASWRDRTEYLCPQCWNMVVSWASRFALQQLELPLP